LQSLKLRRLAKNLTGGQLPATAPECGYFIGRKLLAEGAYGAANAEFFSMYKI
jgi:hypothetical protein|tara:strand:- start:26 stop:184 length:159 start_codon:yes stop_codon:yes gene_type:complete